MEPVEQHKKENSENPFAFCDNFICDPDSVYSIGKTWKEKFSKTLKLMFDIVNKLEKDEKVDESDYTPIEECLNFLLSLIIEKQTNEREKTFISRFVFLAYNINENMNKHSGVQKKIAQLQRYCDDRCTFSEYIMYMRRVNDRAAKWREWLPPSFRLSQHYYNLLKED